MKKTATKKAAPAKKAKAVHKPAVKESPILKEVKQLYGFMQDNNLDTIEYDQKGLYLRLVKAKPAMVPVPVNVGAVAGQTAAGAPVPVQEQYKEVIKSSLMGIFFRGSTPSAPPFVKEGARVEKGDVLFVEKLNAEQDATVTFDSVLVVGEEGNVKVGAPTVEGASVQAKVLKNGKGKKLNIITYRPKKGSARRMGHRQPYTKVEITEING